MPLFPLPHRDDQTLWLVHLYLEARRVCLPCQWKDFNSKKRWYKTNPIDVSPSFLELRTANASYDSLLGMIAFFGVTLFLIGTFQELQPTWAFPGRPWKLETACGIFHIPITPLGFFLVAQAYMFRLILFIGILWDQDSGQRLATCKKNFSRFCHLYITQVILLFLTRYLFWIIMKELIGESFSSSPFQFQIQIWYK